MLSLAPRNRRGIQAFRTFLARFGTFVQFYLVFTAAEVQAIADYADQIAAWTDALRLAPEIAGVDTGAVDRSRDFGWLADHQLLVLHGAALDDALQRLTPDGMPGAIAARRDLLTVPSADVAPLVRQDPPGLLDLMRDALGGARARSHLRLGTDGAVTE